MNVIRSNGVASVVRRPARYAASAYRHYRLRRAARDFSALLISYPKSGRTWLRFILATYFGQLVGHGRNVDLHNMFAFLPNMAWDRVRGVPALSKAVATHHLPLIAVTHEVAGVVERTRTPVILMIRDPRDVLVSSYFHATRHKHRFAGTLDEFVKDEAQGLPHLIRHLNDSAALVAGRPHHIVSYEAVTSAPDAVVADILRFLGQDPVPELLDRAIAAARIDNMRDLEVRDGIPGHEYDRADPDALRARRGIVGGFVDYLDDDTLAWIDDTCAERLTPAAAVLVERTRPIVPLAARGGAGQSAAQ